MGPTGLARDQQCPDHALGVIVLGEQQVLIAPQRRQPALAKGIMLKEDPGPGHLEADIDFTLLLRPLVIIAMTQGKAADAVTLKEMAKALVGFLGQQSNVELAAVELGRVPDI